MSDDQNFDFRNPQNSYQEQDEFVAQTQYHLKNRIDSTANNSWLTSLVFLLLIALVGVGSYSFYQNQQAETRLAQLQNQTPGQVAGVTETTIQNIISGEGFSILANSATPKGFKLEKKSTDFPYIQGKKMVQTSFTSIQKAGNTNLENSITISTSEYDNKLTNPDFSKKVLETLGANYEAKPVQISIPKDIKLIKIIQKTGDKTTNYYTAVTQDNYYVIKVTNQTTLNSEFDEYTKFTDKFLDELYLN
jgi:hypothetical protein